MSESVRKAFNIIIALAVSLGAWTYVVYNNDPMTEMKYKDVPIVFEGEAALANSDLGISQVSDETVDVTLSQPRVKTNEISEEDIRVIADVSEAIEGENGISLSISGPEGTQVVETSRKSISVDVEASDSVEKDIVIEYTDTSGGFEPVAYATTSTSATAIGAQSEVARIYKIAALLKPDDTADNPRNITSTLVALDHDGDEVKHVVIYPDEINFYAYTGITKRVKLIVDAEVPDDNYTRKWTAPNDIMVKGTAAALQDLTQISTVPIDLSYIYEDTSVDLEYDLPEGVYVANASLGKTMWVKVSEEEETDDGDSESSTE